MNLNRIGMLSNLVRDNLKRKPIIILPPNREKPFRISGAVEDVDIAVDADEWVISDQEKEFAIETAKSDSSTEEKILQIYNKLCMDYTYDDNVLSYIRKNDDDSFYLPDEYGRDTDSKWRENRKQHNRRNCFEVSRILARSLKEMFKACGCSKDYDVCIIWDEAVTHYLVGLATKEYCAVLDLDDFTQIKDLTRAKTGLTLEGIKVLHDPSNVFQSAISKYNEGKSENAKKHIEDKRRESEENVYSDDYSANSDDVDFLKFAIETLKEDYNIDSAGMFEYMKEIVDTRLGTRCRKKVWKLVEDEPGAAKKYARCLIVTVGDMQYLIDVAQNDQKNILKPFDEEMLKAPDSPFIPFSAMKREWDNEPYDGR